MPYMIPWERAAERRGRRKGREEGKEVGREVGKVEGMEKKANETALRMLDDGLPIERIAKYTGLSYQEIEKLSAVAH
jgi:predicted transposase/invertase (TIGR01784 family)